MITVGMNYRVLPGKEETFEKAFRNVLGVMGEMEGHTESHLWRDVDEPGSYLITSDWSDREAFDAFLSSDRFRKVADWGSEQILAGRPKHEIYERPGT
jgi:heme-degrading monooxygenase HmoA